MSSLVTFLISIGTTILRGFILSTMWGWFVVTKFSGMPSLGVLEAIGLSFVVGLFNMHSLTVSDHLAISKSNKGDLAAYQLHNAFAVLAATLATWLCAWLVHLCM